jgi:hypothetical protein
MVAVALGLALITPLTEMPRRTLVIGDSTITLPKEECEVRIFPVKTPDGTRVRIVVNGLTIDTKRTSFFNQGRKFTLTANNDGTMILQNGEAESATPNAGP